MTHSVPIQAARPEALRLSLAENTREISLGIGSTLERRAGVQGHGPGWTGVTSTIRAAAGLADILEIAFLPALNRLAVSHTSISLHRK